jgi:hypothetical protein
LKSASNAAPKTSQMMILRPMLFTAYAFPRTCCAAPVSKAQAAA